MKIPKLEIACFNLQSALIAAKNGADRIELCDDPAAGGITPGVEMTRLAKEQISIDLFVMIRPRGGNFVYTESEFNSMKKSIEQLKKMNVNGFVFGILNVDGTVNKKQNTELIELAKPLPCTFHRAFDKAADPLKALEDLIDCGFTTLLTSGQQPDVVAGIDLLAQLVKQANHRIVIMPGGGVRSSNISLLRQKINTDYFHSSAIMQNDIADPEEVKLLKEKLIEKN